MKLLKEISQKMLVIPIVFAIIGFIYGTYPLGYSKIIPFGEFLFYSVVIPASGLVSFLGLPISLASGLVGAFYGLIIGFIIVFIIKLLKKVIYR